MILALSLMALAQDREAPDTGGMGVDCPPGVRPSVTIPEAGTSGVAVDVRPTVAFTDGCGGATRWQLDLIDDHGDIVATTTVEASALVEQVPPIATIVPTANLLPNSDYTLRMSPLDGYYFEPDDVGFRTGDELYEGVHGDPVIRLTQVEYFENDNFIDVIADIETGVAADGLSATYFEGPAGEVFLLGTSGIFPHIESGSFMLDPPVEACARVLQIDGHGQILSAQDCMEPTIIVQDDDRFGRGCTCGERRSTEDTAFEPPEEALLLLGGLGLLLRHRRRGRS